MAVPVDVPQGPGEPVPDPGVPVSGEKAIEGRSPGRIAWTRLKHDKVAVAGGIVVLLLILVAVIGPHLVQNPDTYHSSLINPTFSRPYGPLGGISLDHPLGVEPVTGRDMLARIVDGAQFSMLIGFLATALAVIIGVFFGIVAGYFGGWVDAVIARAMDVFLAFPLLVFAIALVGVIPNTAFGLSNNGLRVVLLIFIIGFFAWPYMGRIVYATLLIPTNILFEAALDYLGVGLIPPTPSWGGILSEAVSNGFYSIDPMYMIIPGLAIFITDMAFNLFGDGLRDALDPRSGR